MTYQAPAVDCPLCPRLVGIPGSQPSGQSRLVQRRGAQLRVARCAVSGGRAGAGRARGEPDGRPFTGDFAGVLLYRTLIKFGFAEGDYGADPADGMVLRDCRVTNAVRCVPPANLPTPVEIKGCNPYLAQELAAMPRLRLVLALGGVSHRAVLRAHGLRASYATFTHGAVHQLADGLQLVDSYHVSRLNTNTGRLTAEMFEALIADIAARLT